MKHLQGETMEQVIERLRSGDAAYAERFTLETRVRIFLGVLEAMRYALARGVLHRDLKPANIMIASVRRGHRLGQQNHPLFASAVQSLISVNFWISQWH